MNVKQCAILLAGVGLAFVVRAAPHLTGWSLNDPDQEVLLRFDGALPEASADPSAWTLSGASIVSARTFGEGSGLALKLARPFDTRSEYVLTGPGVTACTVRRPRPAALPERLVRGAVESPGPASRRTAIAVTEIHAAPPAHPGGPDLRFVELYNSNPYPERIGGFVLSGGLSFTFPSGYVLAGNAYAVVAADAAAMRSAYGLDGVLQAESAKLSFPCTLSLADELGAALGEVEIEDAAPWPAGIAGTGHSLVLARPSYGWTTAEGWARSAFPGGSPGRADPPRPSLCTGVVLNEVLPHGGDGEGYLELYNVDDEACSLSGCTLEIVGRAGAVHAIPTGRSIAAHRTLTFGEKTLGFLVGGEGVEVVLRAPAASGGAVIDALRVPPTEKGRAYGRCPDGGPLASRLAFPTRDGRNAARCRSEVVLNELMYHPITESKDEEYVELRNVSGEAVDLTGWSLSGDVEYAFTERIASGDFLVVPKKKKTFKALYPDATGKLADGSYSGSLPNSRGCVRLARRLSVWSAAAGGEVETDVPVEEVEYRDGGAWGRWSDGGGSSLERVDPRADARLAGSWADSDERDTCAWKTIEWTGPIEFGRDADKYGKPDEVQFGLYAAGECLVDSVELKAEGGENLVIDPSFEAGGTDDWRAFGTHLASAPEAGPSDDGARALHLRACDRLSNGGNCVHGRLSSPLPTKGVGTIRARVKWLAGSPDFLIRARGNWIEACGDILTTRAMGTPGRANGRAAESSAPTVAAVTHLPILPKAGEAVAVWARVDAPDGVAAVELAWHADGAATTNRTPMTACDGGWWRGEIPGAAAGTLVAFHVEAAGADVRSRRSRFPQAQEGLVRFGEDGAPRAFGVYRLWVETAEVERWYRQNRDSNEPRVMTFVYGGDRVIYGGGAEYGGSSWNSKSYPRPGTASSFIDYKASFPKDDPFLGDDGVVLATPGNHGNDRTAVKEQFAYALLRRLGRPSMHRRYVHVIFNGAAQNPMGIHEDTEKPNGDVLEHLFPEKDDGRLYKLDDWFEYDVNAFTNFNGDGIAARLDSYRSGTGDYKVARYRWPWMPRAFDNFQPSDYVDFFGLIDAVNASPALPDDELERTFNAQAFAEVLAVNHFICNNDSYGYGRGKNMYLYDGPSGWEFIGWDMDYSFGDNGISLTTTLDPTPDSFPCADPKARELLRRPANLRRYWRAVARCAAAAEGGAAERAEAVAKYGALAADGVTLKEIEANFLDKMEIRRTNAVEQLRRVDAGAFAVTEPTGASVSVPADCVTFTGTAPFEVETIAFNGKPAQVTWLSPTTWTATLTLERRVTDVEVVASDASGARKASAAFTVTGVPQGEGSLPPVAINEYMSQNTLFVNPRTGAYDDWFELYNHGDAAVDLSGWVVTDTLTAEDPPMPNVKASKSLTFPSGFSLAAGETLLVWTGGVDEYDVSDRGCLQAPFGLGKSADQICLFNAEGRLVDRVTYASAQSATASQGRLPDGTGGWTTLDPPSPGVRNASSASVSRLASHLSTSPASASAAEKAGATVSAVRVAGVSPDAVRPYVADGFEEYAAGASVVDGRDFTLEAFADGTEIRDFSLVRAHDGFVFGRPCGVPDPFAAAEPANALYFGYRTENAGVWRRFDVRPALSEGRLYVDTLVRLNPWPEDADPLACLRKGERFGLWTQETPDGELGLFIGALQYDDDGWETTVGTNVFRVANAIDLSPEAWHRVTVRAVDDVTRARARNPEAYPEGVPGFLVWIDGELLRTAEGEGSFTDGYVDFLAFEPDPRWGWLDWNSPADWEVADLLQSGTVFADLSGTGTAELSGVGFGGTGDVDDLTVTAAQPAGFESSLDFMLLGEADPAFVGVPRTSVADWLASIGATVAAAQGDGRAFASYLFNLGLGLETPPELRITAMEEVEPGVWAVTVRVTAGGGPVALHDGSAPVINGELRVMAADTLAGLETAVPSVRPLVFGADRTEVTIRIPASAGAFFRIAVGRAL